LEDRFLKKGCESSAGFREMKGDKGLLGFGNSTVQYLDHHLSITQLSSVSCHLLQEKYDKNAFFKNATELKK